MKSQKRKKALGDEMSFLEEDEIVEPNLSCIRLNQVHIKMVQAMQKGESRQCDSTKVIPGPKRNQAQPISPEDPMYRLLKKSNQSKFYFPFSDIWHTVRSLFQHKPRTLSFFVLTLVSVFALCVILID